MRAQFITFALLGIFIFFVQSASAAPIDLFQWIYYVDGTMYDSMGQLGSSVLPSIFSNTPPATGVLGTTTVAITGAGNHNFVSFFDYELNESTNGFSNEYATLLNLGSKAAAETWEVDEPGFVFGDIYDNLQLGAAGLDNTNSIPVSSPDDVSVALGWQFDLLAGQSATLTLTVDQSQPVSGFYIAHSDVGTSSQLFYSSSLTINSAETPPNGPIPTPEPSSALLLLSGLCVGWVAKFWRRQI